MVKRLWLAFLLASKGGEGDMATVYTTLIVRGAKTFADVPKVLREQVRAQLCALDLADLAK